MQENTVQENTMQENTVHETTVQENTVYENTVHENTAQENTVHELNQTKNTVVVSESESPSALSQESKETKETKEIVNVRFASTVDDESDSEIEDMPQFEENKDIKKTRTNKQEPDLSKYTKVDNLLEDKPIKPKTRMEMPQVYFLVSFLSPEGIMNCNVRAFKVRGVFPTEEEAMEYAKELENEDKYFKIFCGEVGKWLDFDPPSNKVEREVSSDPNHQKFINAQKKQRMETINAMAGKHIEQFEKKEKGKKERIDESKKSGAASDAMDKLRSKKQKEQNEQNEQKEQTKNEEKGNKKETKNKNNNSQINPRDRAKENTRNRMKQRLAEIQNKKLLANMEEKKDTYFQPTTDTKNPDTKTEIKSLDTKTKVVNKAAKDLDETKSELINVDKNIAAIKQLMANRKAKNN